jgi:hypothetical protein
MTHTAKQLQDAKRSHIITPNVMRKILINGLATTAHRQEIQKDCYSFIRTPTCTQSSSLIQPPYCYNRRPTTFLFFHYCLTITFRCSFVYPFSSYRPIGGCAPTTRFSRTFQSGIMTLHTTSVETTADASLDEMNNATPTKSRKRRSVTKSSAVDSSNIATADTEVVAKKRSATKKGSAVNEQLTNDASLKTEGTAESSISSNKSTKKEIAIAHQVLTDRDELPKLWNDDLAIANGSYSKLE